MSMIAVQTPLDDVRDANTMKAFEAWAGPKGFGLGKIRIQGVFQSYFEPDTDNAWLGYCEAAMQARRVALPIISKLLRKQCGYQSDTK